MPRSNLEFLEAVHEVQVAANAASQMLKSAIDRSPDGQAVLPFEAAHAIATLINIQKDLVTALVEDKSRIRDRIESVLARLEG